MATYYAHSNFRIPTGEFVNTVPQFKEVHTGAKVAQADLGVPDDEWEQMLKNNVISTAPYPDIPDDVSPAEYFRALHGKVVSGDATADEVKLHNRMLLASEPEAVPAPEPEKATPAKTGG